MQCCYCRKQVRDLIRHWRRTTCRFSRERRETSLFWTRNPVTEVQYEVCLSAYLHHHGLLKTVKGDTVFRHRWVEELLPIIQQEVSSRLEAFDREIMSWLNEVLRPDGANPSYKARAMLAAKAMSLD